MHSLVRHAFSALLRLKPAQPLAGKHKQQLKAAPETMAHIPDGITKQAPQRDVCVHRHPIRSGIIGFSCSLLCGDLAHLPAALFVQTPCLLGAHWMCKHCTAALCA